MDASVTSRKIINFVRVYSLANVVNSDWGNMLEDDEVDGLLEVCVCKRRINKKL